MLCQDDCITHCENKKTVTTLNIRIIKHYKIMRDTELYRANTITVQSKVRVEGYNADWHISEDRLKQLIIKPALQSAICEVAIKIVINPNWKCTINYLIIVSAFNYRNRLSRKV